MNSCSADRPSLGALAVIVFSCVGFCGVAVGETGTAVNWAHAGVLAPATWSGPEEKAVAMLVEEMARRTGLTAGVARRFEERRSPLIVLASDAARGALGLPQSWVDVLPAAPLQPEGFAIRATEIGGRAALFVVGRDARGVLFGVGHLLRKLALEDGQAALPVNYQIATAPESRWRGHQLGYRPKTNSYDGWDVADWERYIRDLVIFGANAIELVPPRSDDVGESPHFPLPPLRMMHAMSQLAGDYGLECWIWYPAIDRDYTDHVTRERILAEWEEVFRSLPRIDAVFVPGGDPGRTPPRLLMELLEIQARMLRQHHPCAGLWISPQGFSSARMNEWLAIVAREPEWMTGVVYGPWNRLALPALRDAVPRRYPLRLYPDITHSFLCQLPVPTWDRALASTLGREAVNPRPEDMASAARLQLPISDGFISYSEGCNDDVNKAVWSAMAWNRATPVQEVVRDYARYFIAPKLELEFSEGIFALERNWRGALAANTGVDETLARFRAMETGASPALRRNWRFQQALYRAYYDAHVRRRLRLETEREERALALLAADRSDPIATMRAAEELLFAPETDVELAALRTRVFQLAEALFQSIKMQLSVRLYQATQLPRGANLDAIDFPLNNRGWLRARFAAIAAMTDLAERTRAIRAIMEWKDPGPGGFYDDLGSIGAQPRVVSMGNPASDPEFRSHPLMTYSVRTGEKFEDWRAAWWDHLSAFYGSAVELNYEGLDPGAAYDIRVVYVPTFLPSEIRLVADGDIVVHAAVALKSQEDSPNLHAQTFAIPAEATRDGRLRLRWTVNPDSGELVGFGQVGEVWLRRRPAAAASD